MSFLAFSWGLGMIMAPALGGWLSDPARLYPSLFAAGGALSAGGFFERYPYMLPCMTVAFVAVLGIVAGAVLVVEPPRVRSRKQRQEDQQEERAQLVDTEKMPNSDDNTEGDDEDDDNDDENAPLTATGDGSQSQYEPERDDAEEAAGSTSMHDDRMPSYRELMRGAQGKALCSYAACATSEIVFGEMVPLFGKAAIPAGGLGMDPSSIGLIMSVSGAYLSLYQFFVFKKVVRRLGLVGSYRLGSVCYMCFVGLFPLVYHFADLGQSRPDLSWLLWVYIGAPVHACTTTAHANQNQCQCHSLTRIRRTLCLRLTTARRTSMGCVVLTCSPVCCAVLPCVMCMHINMDTLML
jgi:hypothetical protein